MTIKRTLIGLTFFLMLICCTEKQSELQFEQEVFYEIVPKIIDTFYLEFKEIRPKLIAEFKTKKTGLSKDENVPNFVLAISDSVNDYIQAEDWGFIDHFSKFNISLDTMDNAALYKVELSKLKPSEMFNFKLYSDIPGPSERWKRSKDLYLAGLIGFSRITFDSERKYGFITASMNCGWQCGLISVVYIKKQDEEWIIDDTEDIIVD